MEYSRPKERGRSKRPLTLTAAPTGAAQTGKTVMRMNASMFTVPAPVTVTP